MGVSEAFSRAMITATKQASASETARAEAAVNALTTTTTRAPEAAGSEGGGIVPIAAGAGGGAVLIIIVVIVLVVTRRRQGDRAAPVAKNTSERQVVAFENPMYDNPGPDGMDALYDEAGEGEGLYDEPAFQPQSERSNPMYDSTEGLAMAGEEEEGGGYLDVEESGYLDVA